MKNDPLAIFYLTMQSIGVFVLVKVDAPIASSQQSCSREYLSNKQQFH